MLRKLIYFSPDDGSAGGGEGAGGGGGNGDAAGAGGAGGGGEAKFTQADLDAKIEARLARERKEFTKQLEAERAKSGLSDVERLKKEAEEAKTAANTVLKSANGRVAMAKAEAIAATLGVREALIPKIVKLAADDLLEVKFDDDGRPDANAIQAAIKAVIKDMPEVVGKRGGNIDGGANGNNSSGAKTMDDYIRSGGRR